MNETSIRDWLYDPVGVLRVISEENADGHRVRVAEYLDIPGCIAVAETAEEAVAAVEELKQQFIRRARRVPGTCWLDWRVMVVTRTMRVESTKPEADESNRCAWCVRKAAGFPPGRPEATSNWLSPRDSFASTPCMATPRTPTATTSPSSARNVDAVVQSRSMNRSSRAVSTGCAGPD